MINDLNLVPGQEHAKSGATASGTEWAEIRDANGFLLFELSLVEDVIRIKKRGLTTDVDIRIEKRRRLREVFKSARIAINPRKNVE